MPLPVLGGRAPRSPPSFFWSFSDCPFLFLFFLLFRTSSMGPSVFLSALSKVLSTCRSALRSTRCSSFFSSFLPKPFRIWAWHRLLLPSRNMPSRAKVYLILFFSFMSVLFLDDRSYYISY